MIFSIAAATFLGVVFQGLTSTKGNKIQNIQHYLKLIIRLKQWALYACNVLDESRRDRTNYLWK